MKSEMNFLLMFQIRKPATLEEIWKLEPESLKYTARLASVVIGFTRGSPPRKLKAAKGVIPKNGV